MGFLSFVDGSAPSPQSSHVFLQNKLSEHPGTDSAAKGISRTYAHIYTRTFIHTLTSTLVHSSTHIHMHTHVYDIYTRCILHRFLTFTAGHHQYSNSPSPSLQPSLSVSVSPLDVEVLDIPKVMLTSAAVKADAPLSARGSPTLTHTHTHTHTST